MAAAAGSGGGGGSAAAGGASQVPTANLPVLKSIGKGEGTLNLIAWEGYLQPQWVNPFEKQTGCQVHATYAGTSDQMVALMKNGGGGQYDMVSSSGDADLRIIYAGDAHPVNISLIPSWKDFFPAFKSPAFNTVNGIHYGVSLQWGPNVLMYNKKDFPTAPASWNVIYSPKYKGQVTIPDNPIQIADAALYLKTTQPSLGITDPYELTQPQFQAAVSLLAKQRPLIKKYWDLASAGDLRVQERRCDRRGRLAVPGQRAEGDELPDRLGGPERGRDRLGGHLDAGRQGAAPELLLPVAAVHQHAQGAGGAGGELRRDPGQPAGLQLHGPDPEGLLRGVPRQRAGQLLQLHLAVEDAGRDVR